MPYAVSISRDEASLIREHPISGVTLEGSAVMSFTPSQGGQALADLWAIRTDTPGHARLTDRIATLYGQHLAHARKRGSVQAPESANDEPDLFSHLPPEEPEVQEAPTEQVTKTRRKRSV